MRWINKGQPIVNIKHDVAEEHYNAVYIADLCLTTKNGNYSELPVAVFWQPNPKLPEHSHYFGLFERDGSVLITDASSVAEDVWEGVELPDGEIIFSRFCHDFRYDTKERLFVDGGRDYMRRGGTALHESKRVNLRIIGPNFEIVDEISQETED